VAEITFNLVRGLLCAVLAQIILATSASAQTIDRTVVRPTISQSVGLGEPRAATAGASQIEVFVNSDTMVTNATGLPYQVQIHRVDGIRMLELDLERGLPPNQAEAEVVLRKRLATMGAQFAQRTRQGQIALSAANFYGLRLVPAMVFSGRAVVYGATDVSAAIRVYEAGRAQPIAQRRPDPAKWGLQNSQGGRR
jgi:integrating conjugative element protein (TIGR03757 family)